MTWYPDRSKWKFSNPTTDFFFQEHFNESALYTAFLEAKKSCWSDPAVAEIDIDPYSFISNLSKVILSNQWFPGECKHFIVHDRKTRDIIAPPFEDRVVHHALCAAIENLFDPSFIYHSYSCRKNKGIHAAANCVNDWVYVFKNKYPRPYVVQMDVHRFFPSLDHQYLLDRIQKKLSFSPSTFRLVDVIVNGYIKESKGVPIGSLTSQLFSNIYMDEFDHWCTDQYHAPQYVRYADDFVILCTNHDEAEWWIKFSIDHLRKIKLEPNPKSKMFLLTDNINFCGYRCYGSHIAPRKSNVRNFTNKLQALIDNQASTTELRKLVASFKGYIKHCDSWNLIANLYDQYPILNDIIPLKEMRDE